jgi:hypothetical protein
MGASRSRSRETPKDGVFSGKTASKSERRRLFQKEGVPSEKDGVHSKKMATFSERRRLSPKDGVYSEKPAYVCNQRLNLHHMSHILGKTGPGATNHGLHDLPPLVLRGNVPSSNEVPETASSEHGGGSPLPQGVQISMLGQT